MAKKKAAKSMNRVKRAARAKSHSAPSMDALKDFVRSRGAEYLKDPNVSSVGIGYKTVGGKRTKQLAVQFTVQEKATAGSSRGAEYPFDPGVIHTSVV